MLAGELFKINKMKIFIYFLIIANIIMGSALYFKNQNENIIDLKILNSYKVNKDFIENKKKNENHHNDEDNLSKFSKPKNQLYFIEVIRQTREINNPLKGKLLRKELLCSIPFSRKAIVLDWVGKVLRKTKEDETSIVLVLEIDKNIFLKMTNYTLVDFSEEVNKKYTEIFNKNINKINQDDYVKVSGKLVHANMEEECFLGDESSPRDVNMIKPSFSFILSNLELIKTKK